MSQRKKRNRAFWKNIKFKYKITVVNENTLEEVAGLRVSKLNGMSVMLSALTLIFAVSALIIAFTPLRNYLPGYMNSEVRAQVVTNALRVDSLKALVDRQNLYILNIQDIMSGQIRPDTIHSIDSLTTLREDSLIERTEREAAFRRQYEETEKYNLTTVSANTEVDAPAFFRPVRGMIATGFNPQTGHFGTDIAATPGESILSTLDGTVVDAGYTANGGYTIIVQHHRDLLSVYKHCGTLIKMTGDAVKAGEAIALVGKAIDQSDSPHLHFELWHKGKVQNPETYIVF